MTTPEIICTAKHTDYQPQHVDWRCPKCNAQSDPDHDGLVIVESAGEANPDCCRIHPGDEIECQVCKSTWSGTTLVRVLKKRDHVKTCPTCKGAGVVSAID